MIRVTARHFVRLGSRLPSAATNYAQTALRAYAASASAGPGPEPFARSANSRSGAMGMALALGSALALAGSVTQADCCGIMGVVSNENAGQDQDARGLLLEGLAVLRNRGYDSAGVATVNASDNSLIVSKFASKGNASDSFDLLKNNSAGHIGHRAGIAHTRWATHGGKTDNNAHPHMDYGQRIALVHNGTINNAHHLRQHLEAQGITFKSETDTEVIAHLIGMELDRNPNVPIKEAVALATHQLDGTWGLAVLAHDNPHELVVACNGSPMVIGLGQDHIFVASETAAFNRYTKNFIAMQDGEIAVISPEGCSLDKTRVQQAPDHQIMDSPDPHPHWTIYECLQQPMAIARALAFGGRMTEDTVVLGGPDRARDRLKGIRHLILSACGTSLFASMYGAKLLRDMESVDTAVAQDAAELFAKDIPRHQGGLIAVSQSGETRDVVKSLKEAEHVGVPVMSVVNAVGSAIARETKLGVYLNAGREMAVASTKAFTTQVTVMALLALWFRQIRDEEAAEQNKTGMLELQSSFPDTSHLFDALQRLPISFGMALRVREKCKRVAERLNGKSHCFILGKGYGEPVAYEGALKLKEMAYLHAEGYSGGALKHGPFALIDGPDGKEGSTPVIMIILDDEHAHQMRTAANQVKTRGADVIIITDNPELASGLDEDPIVIPNNDKLTALIAVLPLQLIAYELAVLRGINPDTPRNLAKAVTTD